MLHIGYSADKSDAWQGSFYRGQHGARALGRSIPTSNGSRKLAGRTQSRAKLRPAFDALFADIVDHDMPIRRINLGFGQVLPEEMAELDLFTSEEDVQQERDLQNAMLAIRNKFGKNAMLRANSLQEKATARERNQQIGGHRAN